MNLTVHVCYILHKLFCKFTIQFCFLMHVYFMLENKISNRPHINKLTQFFLMKIMKNIQLNGCLSGDYSENGLVQAF